jgi:hypothetical protein
MNRFYTLFAALAVALCLAVGWVSGAAEAAPMSGLKGLRGEQTSQATQAHSRRYYHCHRRCYRHRGHTHCRRYCHRRRW